MSTLLPNPSWIQRMMERFHLLALSSWDMTFEQHYVFLFVFDKSIMETRGNSTVELICFGLVIMPSWIASSVCCGGCLVWLVSFLPLTWWRGIHSLPQVSCWLVVANMCPCNVVYRLYQQMIRWLNNTGSPGQFDGYGEQIISRCWCNWINEQSGKNE